MVQHSSGNVAGKVKCSTNALSHVLQDSVQQGTSVMLILIWVISEGKKAAPVQTVGWCSDITKHSTRSALQVSGFTDRVSQAQFFPTSR